MWADVVCPFCYLGRRQLAMAIAAFEHAESVVLRHHAFELDPTAPRFIERPVSEILAEKYETSLEQIAAQHARLEDQAAAFGMNWSLAQTQPGNTLDAHRLVKLAEAQDRGAMMLEELYRAHFEEGRRLGDVDTLAELAEQVGVSDAKRVLASDQFLDDVRADELRATQLGLRGVPALVMDDSHLVSGAQGTDAYLAALRQVWELSTQS